MTSNAFTRVRVGAFLKCYCKVQVLNTKLVVASVRLAMQVRSRSGSFSTYLLTYLSK